MHLQPQYGLRKTQRVSKADMQAAVEHQPARTKVVEDAEHLAMVQLFTDTEEAVDSGGDRHAVSSQIQSPGRINLVVVDINETDPAGIGESSGDIALQFYQHPLEAGHLDRGLNNHRVIPLRREAKLAAKQLDVQFREGAHRELANSGHCRPA